MESLQIFDPERGSGILFGWLFFVFLVFGETWPGMQVQ